MVVRRMTQHMFFEFASGSLVDEEIHYFICSHCLKVAVATIVGGKIVVDKPGGGCK